MAFVLTEDQVLLRESAKSFCQEKVPLSVMRRLRDSKDARGYDGKLWNEMVGLGWTGMTIPEAFGGYEFGYSGLGLVLEECGRSLANSPLIATVLLSSSAVLLGGSEPQKQDLLPKIVAGKLLMALAIDEKPLHQPAQVSLMAKASGKNYVLNGRKTFVLDGHIANLLVVSARTAGDATDEEGISLFLVDAKSPGITVTRTWMVDSRNAANITFSNVEVSADNLLGEKNKGFVLLDRVLDTGRIGVAAEMLGSMQEVFDRTVEYLKQREQFGIAIGAFQALQHRAAVMYSEIELCKSVVRAALQALDEDPDAVPELASLAKAKLSEVFFTVSNEGVQMHGGIGMTDEFDIGFFLKRARVAQQFLGDALFHRDRYASLHKF